MSIPLHLAVHVLGLTAAFGLAAFALARPQAVGRGRMSIVIGGLLLAGVHLVSGAFLTDGSWPLYVRTAAYASLAFGGVGGLMGATPVVVAAAPLSAHIAAAVAGVAAAWSSARGRVGQSLPTLPLVVGLVAWAAADALVRTSATLAGGLSIAGSLAIGFWLVRAANQSLLARFVAAFVALLLALVVGLAVASGTLFSNDLREDRLEALGTAASVRADQFSTDWPRDLQASATAVGGERLAEVVAQAAPARTNLDELARELTRLGSVDIALLVDRAGTVLGSWDALSQAPVGGTEQLALAGDPTIGTALAGTTTVGLAGVGDRGLYAIASHPLARAIDGEVRRDDQTGVLLLGRALHDIRALGRSAALAGADVTLVVGGSVAGTTISDPTMAAAVPQALATAAVREGDLGGRNAFIAPAPLIDPDGTVEGVLVFTEDASSVADVQRDTAATLFRIALFALIATALIAAWTARRTTAPITRLTRAAERVAGGDLAFRVDMDRPDEVGRLASAFDHMTESLELREYELIEAAEVESDLRTRLEAVTASMGEGLLATDPDGNVVTVNKTAARLLRSSPGRIVGRDIRRVLRGTVAGEPLIDQLGHVDDLETAEVRGTLGRGRRAVPISAIATPLLDDEGYLLGRVYVMRDITGEVEVERMKTEFLSNISHELRTPLTPIKGYAEVMRVKDIGRERTVEFAENIAEAARRLERIIGMLVDFASLEAGRMEIHLEPTDVGEQIDEVFQRWRKLEPERVFRRRVSKDVPQVNVDPRLLRRCIEELIDNSVKFSEEAITITAERDGIRHVRLTVKDLGMGIEPDALDSILRDFHQEDGSATRRYGGLGLGLSIVQRILDRFGADIVIESELDVGTDVHLYLPVARGKTS